MTRTFTAGKGAQVKRGLTVAVAGAAILVAGLSGCSSDKSSKGGGGSSVAVSGTSVAAGGTSGSKVVIDGKDQNIGGGSVVCAKVGGDVSITIGGTGTGFSALVSDANPPEVKNVVLGTVGGVALGYTSGTGQGNASATKDGNTYKITGTATGVDAANPTAPANKTFEMTAACP
jgi:ipoprotein LpqH